MKTIIVKLRLVPRYGVAVLLAAAASFSGLRLCAAPTPAAVSCTATDPWKDEDGKWWVTVRCAGDFLSEGNYLLEDIYGEGGCTNCTAMSPAECEAHKLMISGLATNTLYSLELAEQQRQMLETSLDQALSTLQMIPSEGGQFVFYESNSSVPGSSPSERNNTLLQGPTGPYLYTYSSQPASSQSHYVGGNDAVYNYYNEGVKPIVSQTVDYLMPMYRVLNAQEQSLLEARMSVNTLNNYVSSISCAACPNGGGGGGGSSSSDPCPCSEILEHIKNLVQEKRDIIKNWNDVELPKLKEWLKRVESMIKVIQDAVAPIGTNFVNAVNFKDNNYQSFSFPDKHEELWQNGDFDFGEYGNLSWFSRVEYLLLNLNGIFDKTNSVSEVEEALKKAEVSLESNASNQTSIENSLTQLSQSSFDRIATAISSMFESFQFFGSGQSSIQGAVIIHGNLSGFIQGLDNVSVEAFSGDQQLIQTVDRLVGFVRVSFQVIYAAVFLFLYYILSVFLFHRISKLVIWLCSFYSSVFGS